MGARKPRKVYKKKALRNEEIQRVIQMRKSVIIHGWNPKTNMKMLILTSQAKYLTPN